MALSTIFATLPTGNVAASTLDTNFNQVGAMGITQCTATGTNTIALTQAANQPTIAAYANYLEFGFVAANTTSGAVTVNVNGIGALPLYRSDLVQASTGDITQNVFYVIAYNSALNSGSGGFQILTSSTAGTRQWQLTAITASGTFTTSANITTATKFKFTVVGGGGGGGGCSNASGAVGGGGGAGATSIYWTSGLTASTGYTATVGTGGAGGANTGGTGGTGNTSSIVIGGTTPTAAGGVGGTGSTVTGATTTNGGAGGAASNGTINITGGGGGCAIASAAGTGISGGGGASSLGGGGRPVTGGGQTGSAGAAYGSGGSGASALSGGAVVGGAGADGIIIVEWLE